MVRMAARPMFPSSIVWGLVECWSFLWFMDRSRILAAATVVSSSTTTTTTTTTLEQTTADPQPWHWEQPPRRNPTKLHQPPKHEWVEDERDHQSPKTTVPVHWVEHNHHHHHVRFTEDVSERTTDVGLDMAQEHEEGDQEEEYDQGDWEEDEGDWEEEYDEEEEYGLRFGVPQLIHVDHAEQDAIEAAFLHHIEETERYWHEFATTVDRYVSLRRTCRNRQESCTHWAMQGECEGNPDYMLEECAAACHACRPPTGPGVEFGVPQLLHSRPPLERQEEGDETIMCINDDETHDTAFATLLASQLMTEPEPFVLPEAIEAQLAATTEYMNHVVWPDDRYRKVHNLCFNKDARCTVWAAQGKCQDDDNDDNDNEHSLRRICAPACQSCLQVHYETRCPLNETLFPDIWQPGDLNRMFERIVADNRYQTTVWSRPDPATAPDTIDSHDGNHDSEEGAWIVTIDDFFTEQEATRLMEWGQELGYERSLETSGDVNDETGEAFDHDYNDLRRTSTNAWCSEDCDWDPLVVGLFDRLYELTGIPPSHSEELQLLHYEPGQFYTVHGDYAAYSDRHVAGPRILTVFLYLNTVEEGGATRFDWSNLTVTPQLGRIALWPNVLDQDPSQREERTFHEAMPVLEGVKYGANAWFHLRDWEQATELGC